MRFKPNASMHLPMAPAFWWTGCGHGAFPKSKPTWTAGWPPAPSCASASANFERFAELYRAELDASGEAQAAARQVIAESNKGIVTLLYGARDPQVNHAIVLKA